MDPPTTSQDVGHPRKKPKQQLKVEQVAKPCHITRLPVEILAEILSYTRVNDILAVARTSKYYCGTLVQNPASTYIWKEARARFKPKPIPDPTPNFTEPSYAAFLFDRGICEICQAKTKEPLVSYSLRLRLCNRTSCHNVWRNNKAKMIYPPSYGLIDSEARELLAPLLPLENNSQLVNARAAHYYRLDDYAQHADARNRIQAIPSTRANYARTINLRIEHKKPTLELCQKLLDWRGEYDRVAEKVKKANLATAAKIALSEGWKTHDLHQCPSFALLYVSKAADLVEFTVEDFGRIKPQVQRELEALHAEQQRYKGVRTIEDQREAITKLYERMKSQPGVIVPPLATFRKLPFVRRVAGSSTSQDVTKEIEQSKLVAQLAQDDVDTWVQGAKEAMSNVLGFAPPNETSSASLAPVERLTARFRCKRCDSQPNWPGDGSMSFVEACAHQCAHTRRRPSAQKPWNAAQFVPDYKAIDVVQQVLMWCGYTADDALSLEAPEEVGTRIQCLSCPSRIVMTYNNLFSHCYRHETMQLRPLPVAEVADILQYPIAVGRRAQLIARSEKSEAERQRRVYGCRHCQQKTSVPSEGDASTRPDINMADAPSQLDSATSGPDHTQDGARGSQGEAAKVKHKKSKSAQLFQFDGLRSHAQEKHGILWIGDEDFFEHLEDEAVPLDSNPSTSTPSF